MTNIIPLTPGCKLFVKDRQTGTITEITNNLYFFEQSQINSIEDIEALGTTWDIWIEQPNEIAALAFEDSAPGSLVARLPGYPFAWIRDLIKTRAEANKQTAGSYLQVDDPNKDNMQDLLVHLVDTAVVAHERWLATGDGKFWTIQEAALSSLRSLRDLVR